MRRLIPLLVLCALTAPVVVASPATACSCARVTDQMARSSAGVVVTGDVVGYEERGDPLRPGQGAAIWTVAVSRVYKGQVPSNLRIGSAIGGGSCGLEIPRSGAVLLFASGPVSARPAFDGIALTAGLCGGTRRLDQAPVPASFGAGDEPGGPDTKPVPASPGVEEPVARDTDAAAWRVLGTIAGLVALLGIGAGLAARRRRTP